MGRRARTWLVWLHVITSVGWMSQALALFTLMTYGLTAGDPHAFRMAEVLDVHLLANLANASAFSGIMLAGLTRWGYFQYWWVAVKFAITMVQLYLAIFLLSPQLDALASGAQAPSGPVAAGPLLMASAVAFQGWLSVAKPWRRTPWAGAPAKPPEVPGRFTVFVLVAPLLDVMLGAWLGHPAPLLFVVTATVFPFWRRRRGKGSL